MRESSYAYVRFGFFLGFFAASMGTLYLACRVLDVPIDILWGGSGLQNAPLGKRTLLLVGPLLIGFIGGVFGMTLLASVGRGSVKVEQFLGSLWHYSSTGFLVWSMLSFFQLLVGFGGAIFLKGFPIMKTTMIVGSSDLVSGALICVILFAAGSMMQSGSMEAGRRLSRLGSLAVGVAAGIIQGLILHLPWWAGVIAGLLYPSMLIPWAAEMCRRDGLR